MNLMSSEVGRGELRLLIHSWPGQIKNFFIFALVYSSSAKFQIFMIQVLPLIRQRVQTVSKLGHALLRYGVKANSDPVKCI